MINDQRRRLLRRRGALVAAGICLVTWACSNVEEEPEPEVPWQQPNIVLISIDTLRADRMSLYGYERSTTPFLDQLARDSIVFESFHYSGGGTLPSHMTMMTSLYPRTHMIHPGNQRVLEDERVTLAEQLHARGYSTGAFTDGGWMRGRFGFEQGFDSYDDLGGGFETILPKAISWIEAHADQPFFLFLHTYDVHSNPDTELPYSCPGDFHLEYLKGDTGDFDGCIDDLCGARLLATINGDVKEGRKTVQDVFSPQEIQTISDLYDGCINYVDREIEGLYDVLVSMGLEANTALVITSDHGEEFAEHGMLLHEQGGYEEFSHLPLLITMPNHPGIDQRRPGLVTMVDVMPTILDLARVSPNPQIQGVSALSAVDDDERIRDDLHMYSVLRTEDWKYFRDSNQLFDLETDTKEIENVVDQHPELVERLTSRINELIKVDVESYDSFQASKQLADEKAVELSEQEKKNLEALGYLE